MIGPFIILLFTLQLQVECKANDIDKIQTITDVNNFLIKKINKKFRENLPLDESPKPGDTSSYQRNCFFKVDINNYLKLEELKGEYAVKWTDDQMVTTEIRYNEKSKAIEDYGLIGTYGLNRLYSKFFKWRKLIEWYEE